MFVVVARSEGREVVEFALSKEMLVGIKRARHGCGGRAARRGERRGRGRKDMSEMYTCMGEVLLGKRCKRIKNKAMGKRERKARRKDYETGSIKKINDFTTKIKHST